MPDHLFPATGHRYLADYSTFAFHVEFDNDGKTLRWADAAAKNFDEIATTEHYQKKILRPGVFWVTWKEADGTTVSHVEDFDNEKVYASITLPDHTFITVEGIWKRLDTEKVE